MASGADFHFQKATAQENLPSPLFFKKGNPSLRKGRLGGIL